VSWYETFQLVADENIGVIIAVAAFVLIGWAGLRRKKK
jgi:hypothetical protein